MISSARLSLDTLFFLNNGMFSSVTRVGEEDSGSEPQGLVLPLLSSCSPLPLSPPQAPGIHDPYQMVLPQVGKGA